MRRHHVVLIGLAAVGAVVEQRAIARPDILALMAFAAGALADEEIAVLAEIIAPRIGVVGGLVEHQRPPVHPAGIGRALAAQCRASGR